MTGAATPDAKTDAPLRERVLAKAMELLEREGPEAITLRAVASAVGVSHMAPYRHFKDKEELLAALAQTGFEALGLAMQNAALARPAKAGGKGKGGRLLGFGRAYLDFARRRPALYRLMFGPTLANKPQYEHFQAAAQATFAGLRYAIGATLQSRAPTAGEADVNALAVATWSLVHGLAMLMIDGRLAASGDRAAEDALISRVLTLHGRTFQQPDQSR